MLEARRLLASIDWTGKGDGTSWNDAVNWAGGTLPGPTDDVVINTSSPATIVIQAGDQLSVQSLTTAADDTLFMSGNGSLTLNGNSSLSGPLTMSGGSLTATGAGVAVVASGPTSASAADLTALAGATLSLPQLKSYTAGSVSGRIAGSEFDADGANSVLDVSALATASENLYAAGVASWNLDATDGGTLNLSGLTGTLSCPNGIQIIDTDGGTLLDGNLTGFDSADAMTLISLDGSDAHVADSWTTLVGSTLSITGGSYTLPKLNDLDMSSINVTRGGSLSLPGLKSYESGALAVAGSGGFAVGTGFEADGAHSVLDLSALATVTQNNAWDIAATDGGTLKLSGLSGTLDATDGVSIVDSGGSTLSLATLTALDNVHVSLDGSDAHVADAWTAFTNGSLTVTGGSYSLPNLTDVDGSSLSVSTGASLALPKLTSYSSGNSGSATSFSVGGVLSLPALVNVTQKAGWTIDIGQIDSIGGVQGEVDLSSLTSLSGSKGIAIDDFGTLLAGKLTSLSGVDVSLNGSDVRVASTWTSLTNGSLTIDDSSYSLPQLTDIDGSSLTIGQVLAAGTEVLSPASLTLAGVTSYSPNGNNFQANNDFGSLQSVLNLPALKSVTPQGAWGIFLSNDELDLSALTSLTVPGGFSIGEADGSKLNLSKLASLTVAGGIGLATNDSQLDLTSLTSLTSTSSITLSDTNGSTLLDGKLTSLSDADVTLQGDAQVVDSWTTLSGTLSVAGAAYTLANLTEAHLLPDKANGPLGLSVDSSASLSLPALASGDIALSNGDAVTIRGTVVAFPAAGASGGVINVPDLPAGLTLDLVNAGTLTDTTLNVAAEATVDMDTIAHYSSTTSESPVWDGVTFNVAAGGNVDLTTGQDIQYAGTLAGSGTGTVTLADGTLDGETAGVALNFTGNLFQWTSGNLTGDVANLGTVTLAGSGTIPDGTLANSGTLTLSAGAGIGLGQVLLYTTGIVKDIPGNVTNSGTLNLAPGSSLSFRVGDFTQTSVGTLNDQIGGTPGSGQYGSIAAQSAVLAGTFNLALLNGFMPAAGDDYTVITGVASGSFAQFNGLPQGMTATQSTTAIDLTVASAPPTTPVAVPLSVVDETYVIGSGNTTVSAASGVLTGDKGTNPLSVTAGTVTGGQGGSFVFAADGSFTYTPAANFPGYDSAPFTVTDASGDKATQTVTVLSQHASVVWKFYESVLNRVPDAAGLQYWTNYFNSGGQTGQMAVGFFESSELLDKIITEYYQQYLLRTPDASGLAFWVGEWQATGEPEGIKAGFADSPEFYDSAGGTPQSWLTALYQRILNRTPDPAGESYWLNYYQQQAAAGTAASDVQQQIALGFFDSAEAYGDDVTGWFNEYLGRNPASSEQSQYVGQMESGATDRDIEQDITNLPEYANNPPAPADGTAAPLPDYYQTPAASASSQAIVAAKDTVFSQLGD